MTNIDITDNIQIDGAEIENVTYNKFLGQTTAIENTTKQGISTRINAGWSVFEK